MDADSDDDGPRALLDEAMRERSVELGLRWKQVAERAAMTYGNLHKIRTGQIALTDLAQRNLERALEWPRGHISEFLAAAARSAGDDGRRELLLQVHDYAAELDSNGVTRLRADINAVLDRFTSGEGENLSGEGAAGK